MADENHRRRLQQIFDMHKAGQKREAIRLIGEVIKTNLKDADAWYIAGEMTEDSARKIKLLKRALSINPSHQAARTTLDNLREAHELFGTASDSDNLFDDHIDPPRSVSAAVDLANPGIIAAMIAGTVLVGLLLGVLCLATISSGRFLGIVLAPTAAPSKTPTVTPTFTPTHTPTPTQDIIATATVLASTQQHFDSTSTAVALMTDQALAQTQVAQQFSQTATVVSVANQQIETAIAATASASSQIVPTWTVPPSTATMTTSPLQTPLPSASRYINLDFLPTALDYSAPLDRLIFVSANPNQVHIFNPNTAEDRIVELSAIPRAIDVGPDGLFAAVGHDAMISYIDLQNARVQTTLDLTVNVDAIALAGNGWIYVTPLHDPLQNLYAINIAGKSEIAASNNSLRYGAQARLHPDGNRLYAATQRLNPGTIFRFDLVDNVPLEAQRAYFGVDNRTCNALWFSADGSRIFTACGDVFRSSVNIDEDMTYIDSFVNLSRMAYMVHAPSVGQVVGISAGDNTLGVWDYETYQQLALFQLPQMIVSYRLQPVIGFSVFVDAAAAHYYAIVRTDQHESRENVFALLVGDLPR